MKVVLGTEARKRQQIEQDRRKHDNITRGILKKYQEDCGYSDADMASVMGIPVSRYKSRLKEPSKLSLEELRPLVSGMSELDTLELYGFRANIKVLKEKDYAE